MPVGIIIKINPMGGIISLEGRFVRFWRGDMATGSSYQDLKAGQTVEFTHDDGPLGQLVAKNVSPSSIAAVRTTSDQHLKYTKGEKCKANRKMTDEEARRIVEDDLRPIKERSRALFELERRMSAENERMRRAINGDQWLSDNDFTSDSEICTACDGTGKYECPVCDGRGDQSYRGSSQRCDVCFGKGYCTCSGCVGLGYR